MSLSGNVKIKKTTNTLSAAVGNENILGEYSL